MLFRRKKREPETHTESCWGSDKVLMSEALDDLSLQAAFAERGLFLDESAVRADIALNGDREIELPCREKYVGTFAHYKWTCRRH